MPTIDSAQMINNVTPNTPVVGQAGGPLGKNEFLLLLTTQLQNQDPLKPVDNTQMIAQMAQFGALEQMQNLNGQFTEFRREMALGFSSMIGGQDVKLTFIDGSETTGILNGVTWQNDKMLLDVGGQLYPMDGIAGLARVVHAPAAAL